MANTLHFFFLRAELEKEDLSITLFSNSLKSCCSQNLKAAIDMWILSFSTLSMERE